MKLLDFKQSERLDGLRKSMKTENYGEFELFDPKRHLSWQERKQLSDSWQAVASSALHAYSDQTLAYKNTHIFCQDNNAVHFAFCDSIKKNLHQGKMLKVNVTLNIDALASESVCQYCLHAISYEGFDVYRHRHKEYNDNILKTFNLTQYLEGKYK